MGRRPFGAGNVFKAILELATPNKEVFQPLVKIGEKTGLGVHTVRKYLAELVASQHIQLVYGGVRGAEIESLDILKTELPLTTTSKMSVSTPSVILRKAPQQEISIPKELESSPEPPSSSYVVGLVDYDNVMGRAKESGINFSFSKLKDFFRSHGQLLFADVFLSPSSMRQENIALLWEAGFQVIACPFATKDKDSVDSKIIWRARQYLTATPVTHIFIVSCDRDFHDLIDFAADIHKKVTLLNIATEREKLTGYDAPPQLKESNHLRLFSEALRFIEQNISPPRKECEQRIRFLKTIIRTVANVTRRSSKLFGFKMLITYTWRSIASEWSKIYSERDLKTALSALVDKNIIIKNEGAHITYYTLDSKHRAVTQALNSSRAA